MVEEREVVELVTDRLLLFRSASLKDFEEREALLGVLLGVPALRLAVLPLEDLL